ncbi:MAG TPA: hypothetical protein VFC10_04540 [Terriglobia bacterium]|jgi:hypothetical protein|nr:hypothetical protein [Terriglobia bacterium]
MDPQQDDEYLRYAVTRVAPYRNVWRAMANEFDFIDPPKDWDHIFQMVNALDPYHHLRGIHKRYMLYDHAEPWVTHCVIQLQTGDGYAVALGARPKYNKPVIIDEYGYEGNNGARRGNPSAHREVLRYGDFAMAGAYRSHRETYVHPGDILWWAVGSTLVGESPARLAFLKKILSEAPYQNLEPNPSIIKGGVALAVKNEYCLLYFSAANLKYIAEVQIEGAGPFDLELIGPWLMKIYKVGLVKTGHHAFRPKCTSSLLWITRSSQSSSVTRSIDEILWHSQVEWESRLMHD